MVPEHEALFRLKKELDDIAEKRAYVFCYISSAGNVFRVLYRTILMNCVLLMMPNDKLSLSWSWNYVPVLMRDDDSELYSCIVCFDSNESLSSIYLYIYIYSDYRMIRYIDCYDRVTCCGSIYIIQYHAHDIVSMIYICYFVYPLDQRLYIYIYIYLKRGFDSVGRLLLRANTMADFIQRRHAMVQQAHENRRNHVSV
jgi:hypothetical protein